MNPTDLSPELRLAQSKVLERLGKVEEALKGNDPLISIHCESIHAALREHEELVHLLSDEQIGKLMAGMQKYKAIQLVKEASSTKGRGKKVTADDL